MGFLNSHQYTAVTSIINDCCAQNEPSGDDYYIETQLSSLLDAIRNQKDFSEPGPIEAARALRKKLKYGDVKDQYNALKILDLLIVNGGNEIKSLCDDDKLLNRLQFYFKDPSAPSSSSSVNLNDVPNKKVAELARSLMSNWYNEFRDDDRLRNINLLYERNMKGRRLKKRSTQQYSSSKYDRTEVPDFMNDEADMDYTPFGNDDDDISYNNNNNNDSGRYNSYNESIDDNSYSRFNSRDSQINRPKTNAELDKKFKIPRINYEKEAPKIMQLIAQANIMATNLLNILSSLDKDELSIHSIKANDAFDECRAIRRKVLRYLQLVNKEELLGPLLKCNDDLVVSLKKYEEQSVPSEARVKNNEDSDSDSDYDSMQDYESDHEPVNPKPLQSSSSIAAVTKSRSEPKSQRSNYNDEYDSDDDYDDDEDDDYSDSYISKDRFVKENPPVKSYSSSSSSLSKKKIPPPIPAKRSALQSAKMNNIPSRAQKDDYDPFSDDNEVAPLTWS